MKAHLHKVIAIVAGLAIPAYAFGTASANQSMENHDVSALHQLWSRYQQAVARKDAKTMLGLYVSDDVPVMGGIAPKSYAIMTAANKQRVPRIFVVTAKEDVAGEVKLPPDKTENLDIHSDGEIGSISFDYAAQVGHGRIVWTTIHTNDGWKIASVTYSINIPAADNKSTSG